MDWIQAFLLGFVQGITEFLPVSSSGHLAIGRELLGVEASGDIVFEVAVHAATVLSTIIVFRSQIGGLLENFFKPGGSDSRNYVLKIGLSMIPVFIAGVFFKDDVEALFSSVKVVGAGLLATALLLFLSDRMPAPHVKESRGGISCLQALAVGIAQACACVPGLSRSGTTISVGLFCGMKRESVAQFSFLMVLIPVLGEAFLNLAGGDFSSSTVGLMPLGVGFLSAFVTGMFACRVMIALVKKARLGWFALYCALAGLSVLIFM